MLSSRKTIDYIFVELCCIFLSNPDSYMCIIGAKVYLSIDGCVNQCQTVTVYINLSKIGYLDMGILIFPTLPIMVQKMLI
jgi:hypothetical protein